MLNVYTANVKTNLQFNFNTLFNVKQFLHFFFSSLFAKSNAKKKKKTSILLLNTFQLILKLITNLFKETLIVFYKIIANKI